MYRMWLTGDFKTSVGVLLVSSSFQTLPLTNKSQIYTQRKWTNATLIDFRISIICVHRETELEIGRERLEAQWSCSTSVMLLLKPRHENNHIHTQASSKQRSLKAGVHMSTTTAKGQTGHRNQYETELDATGLSNSLWGPDDHCEEDSVWCGMKIFPCIFFFFFARVCVCVWSGERDICTWCPPLFFFFSSLVCLLAAAV